MEVLAPEGIVIEWADNMAGHESAGKSGQIVHLLIYNNIFFFSLHLLLLSTTVQQLWGGQPSAYKVETFLSLYLSIYHQ